MADTVKDGFEQPKIKSRKNLYILGSTVMLCLSSYEGVLGIESSINVEEGMGTLSVMTIFIISSLSCVIIVPNLIDFWGAKAAIIIGEVGMAVYVAANFYPTWFTLMAAAVFHGITESAPWAGTSVYVTFLGNQKSKKQEKLGETSPKKQKSYVFKYFGKFYSFAFVGAVVGNGILSLILLGFQSFDSDITSFNQTTSTATTSIQFSELINSSFHPTEQNHEFRSLEKCGANDCQADYIYSDSEEELDKFNPSQISIYVLLSVFLALSMIGIIIQIIFLERAPAKFDKPNLSHEKEKKLLGDDQNVADYGVFRKLLTQLQDLYRHFFSLQHLLVAPIVFYYGLYYAYGLTEYTRAFVSCTIGVEKIGFALMTYASSAALISLIYSKLVLILGRKKYAVCIGIFHLGLYLVQLFWIPASNNLWAIFVIGGLIGMGDGLLTTHTQGIFALYFDENKLGIAYSVSNLVTNLGIVAATAWSATLCVYTKIYIQIGFMIGAILFLFAAEIYFSKNDKRQTEIDDHNLDAFELS